MSSPNSTKTLDEAIAIVVKFGIKLGGDAKFCLVDRLVDKMGLFKKKGVEKELL